MKCPYPKHTPQAFISNYFEMLDLIAQKNQKECGDFCQFKFVFNRNPGEIRFNSINATFLGSFNLDTHFIEKPGDRNSFDLYEILKILAQSPWDSEFLDNLGWNCFKIRMNSVQTQKQLGAFYTPKSVAEYLTDRLYKYYLLDQFGLSNELLISPALPLPLLLAKIKEQVDSNAFENIMQSVREKWLKLRICDPSCGGGEFLVSIFRIWLHYLPELGLAQHEITSILEIYGYDIDPIAIYISRIQMALALLNARNSKDLPILDNKILSDWGWVQTQIIIQNTLEIKPEQFLPMDLIIGNPPYQNLIENEAIRKYLAANFPEIYHGKLDLCYYFLPKGLNLLKKKGFLGFVLKRYFLKSPTASSLRKSLVQRSAPQEIMDFGNVNVFPDAGIQTLLFITQNASKTLNMNYFQYSQEYGFQSLDVSKVHLNSKVFLSESGDRWLREDETKIVPFVHSFFEYCISEKILTLKCDTSVGQIPLFKLVKGIQTGKDAVFIGDTSKFKGFEPDRIRNFIKGQHVLPFFIAASNKSIIISHQYSPIIGITEAGVSKYPVIEKYLRIQESGLRNRSRAKEDRWSYWRQGDERETVDFNLPKIVWPYRGKSFRVAIDWYGSYHSQDVILLTINIKGMEEKISHLEKEQLLQDWKSNGIYFYLGLLNSTIFSKILFQHAKEFAQDVKDFQPNNFQDLKIPLWDANDPQHQIIMETAQSLERIQSKTMLKELNSDLLIMEIKAKLDSAADQIFSHEKV